MPRPMRIKATIVQVDFAFILVPAPILVPASILDRSARGPCKGLLRDRPPLAVRMRTSFFDPNQVSWLRPHRARPLAPIWTVVKCAPVHFNAAMAGPVPAISFRNALPV